MSDDKDLGVDPRYDPAFQRGFDQTIPVEEYVPELLLRKTASPPAPPAPVVAPPIVAHVPPPVQWVEATAIAAAADPDVVVGEPAAESESESDSNPTRNPFLLFLAIIAIALVAIGIWLFVRSGDAFNSREVRSQGDYMSLDATIHMAPFIALLGAATAIGVVFVFASKWKRQR
jgi:hypothetical protein